MIFVILAASAYRLSPAGMRWTWLLPSLNLLFIIGLGLNRVGPLLALITAGYGFYRIFPKLATTWSRGAAIGVLLLLFAVVKRYSFVAPILPQKWDYTTIGMSYILFRVIHLAVDSAGGSVPSQLSPLAYWRYVAYFPALASGPVQRFDDFEKAAMRRPGGAWTASALAMMLDGYFRCVVLSGAASWVFRLLSDGRDWLGACGGLCYGVAAAVYMVNLYLNFSGYIAVMRGVSRLFDLELPSNFEQPFAARSFLELWSRWHITMSQWFKAYVFNPLVRRLSQRWPGRDKLPYLGAAGYLATFFVMGVWHGTTPGFVVYGLVLGLGACGNKLFEVKMRAWLGKARYTALAANFYYRTVSGALCFAYFSLGLCFFWQTYQNWSQTISKLRLVGTIEAFGAAFGASLVVMATSAACKMLKEKMAQWRPLTAVDETAAACGLKV